MTYIDYINQFWKMNRSVEFSPNEVFLYFYLLNECNIRGWQNPFEHPNKTIVLATGISEKILRNIHSPIISEENLQILQACIWHSLQRFCWTTTFTSSCELQNPISRSGCTTLKAVMRRCSTAVTIVKGLCFRGASTR